EKKNFFQKEGQSGRFIPDLKVGDFSLGDYVKKIGIIIAVAIVFIPALLVSGIQKITSKTR
ncbi:MAG: hypothetical protein CVT48_06300, partial [Thermoplasmata archaeon HGW-Thermoplasmata-1]